MGPHVASYKGCPEYKKQAFRQHVVNNQKSYAAAVSQKPFSQPKTPQTFQFTVEQLTKFVANVVIQIAQPQCATLAIPSRLSPSSLKPPPRSLLCIVIRDRYLLINFMCLNIVFWNCQGIRPKRKELELYLDEDATDIIALNETFLSIKHNFKIPGYDTIRNDRSTGLRGGVAFLVKHGLVINKEYRNADFNIIIENEALAINLELSHNQNLTLATIYCPNDIPTLHFSKPLTTFLIMSCLLVILTQN